MVFFVKFHGKRSCRITILQNFGSNDILSRMNQLVHWSTTFIICLGVSLQPVAIASPSTVGDQPLSGTTPQKITANTDDPGLKNHYTTNNSLPWLIYAMFLSLPFAPSRTQYRPIQVPVNLPDFHLPEPRASQLNIPKLKTPSISVPKLKKPQ